MGCDGCRNDRCKHENASVDPNREGHMICLDCFAIWQIEGVKKIDGTVMEKVERSLDERFKKRL